MKHVSLAEAKARLNGLVNRAAAGEVVLIVRRGKPVAKLVAAETLPKRIDVEALRKLTARLPRQKVSAGTFMRKMRESDRY